MALILLVQCAQKEKRSIASQMTEAKPEFVQQNYEYELCRSEKKSYLEEQILKLPTEYVQDHSDEWRDKISLKCIQFAQKNHRGHYALCADENAKPEATVFKPCLSENYVKLSYNAFHDIMDCFNLDPKEFYLQIMIESGFHVNAFNKSGYDSGVAQFTANGIKRVVTDNRLSRTRRILLESSRASCQRIASVVGQFDISSFSPETRCSMISLPRNPYRSMLFNYLHTMLDQIDLKRQIDDELSGLNEIQTALTEKIKRQLIYLAYNRGMTGIKRLLEGYIANRKAVYREISESDLDLNQNLTRVKGVLRLEPYKRVQLKKARIKKLSFAEYAVINDASYVADMIEAQDYVRRYLGDECSRF